MHWINAVAIFIMIGSGWKIYNDDVIFGWLHFPDFLIIGKWAQHGLQWHFFGMWIFVLNGLAYLTYGIATGRFRRKLLPISLRDLLTTIGDALRFRLAHDDLTHYNAVQKILYLGVMLIGILIVISGLALWKPVQFSELAALFGSFQTIRIVHFLCMAAIVGFFVVHVALALLVPQTLVAMVTGGPVVATTVTMADAGRGAAGPGSDDSDAITHPHAVDVSAEKAARPERADGEPRTRRRHQPARRAARHAQPRRADAVDRLRRDRGRAGTEVAARGVGVERPRAGRAVPARSSGADLHAGAGGQAAAL